MNFQQDFLTRNFYDKFENYTSLHTCNLVDSVSMWERVSGKERDCKRENVENIFSRVECSFDFMEVNFMKFSPSKNQMNIHNDSLSKRC